MIPANTTLNPGERLRWLNEQPARSFTLFKRHLPLGRIARSTERVVFLGGAAVAALLMLSGSSTWVGLLEALIELKVTALIFSQVAHVFVNVVRYVLVPSDRSEMREKSPVVFRPPAPYVPDVAGFDPAGHGFSKPTDHVKPNETPTSTTVNVPSADHGVPERFIQR